MADPPVLFTTAYSEYAAESYELQAVDYLVKPVSFNRFLKAVNRAAQLHPHSRPVYTFVKTGHQYVRLEFDQVRYVQAATNYVDFYTTENRVTVRMKLLEAAELLPDTFVRIHRSFLVNLDYIDRIEHNHVWVGEAKLAIGASYREAFMQKLQD